MLSQKPIAIIKDKETGDTKTSSTISKLTYQQAVYFGPSVRYVNIDLSNPSHKASLQNLDIFLSDSIYRNLLSDSKDEIVELRSNYSDIRGRIVNQFPFYGVGGCATLNSVAGYAVGMSIKGVYIGINTLEEDNLRIKIEANKIYPTLYGSENPCGIENEILHMYLDENQSIVLTPGKGIRESFSSYAA